MVDGIEELSRPGRRALCVAALVLSVTAGACGGSPTLRAAEAGRFDEARSSLEGEAARELARFVARGELSRARGSLGAGTVRELSGCARSLEDELEAKAAGDDEAAAAAATMRIEASLSGDAEVARATSFVTVDAGSRLEPGARAAWRAAGARALFRSGDGAARRALFVDGDQEVRLGALRAAIAAGDVEDAPGVLEAARLDPYPMASSAAIRAAGAIGGERVVLALKDLWATGDEASRQAIADAWAASRAVDVGGRRELLWAEASARGAPAIAAAYALVRLGAAGASDATQMLVRAIDEGLGRDRVFAIGVAPLDGAGVPEALAKARDDVDDAVSLAALVRTLDAAFAAEGSTLRRETVAKLVAVANGDTRRATQASLALARAGAREVVPALLRDVTSKDALVRRNAGMGLVELGEAERAKPLLVDSDSHVRRQLACAVLRAP